MWVLNTYVFHTVVSLFIHLSFTFGLWNILLQNIFFFVFIQEVGWITESFSRGEGQSGKPEWATSEGEVTQRAGAQRDERETSVSNQWPSGEDCKPGWYFRTTLQVLHALYWQRLCFVVLSLALAQYLAILNCVQQSETCYLIYWYLLLHGVIRYKSELNCFPKQPRSDITEYLSNTSKMTGQQCGWPHWAVLPLSH